MNTVSPSPACRIYPSIHPPPGGLTHFILDQLILAVCTLFNPVGGGGISPVSRVLLDTKNFKLGRTLDFGIYEVSSTF